MFDFIKNHKFAIAGFFMTYFVFWLWGFDNLFSRGKNAGFAFLIACITSFSVSIFDINCRD